MTRTCQEHCHRGGGEIAHLQAYKGHRDPINDNWCNEGYIKSPSRQTISNLQQLQRSADTACVNIVPFYVQHCSLRQSRQGFVAGLYHTIRPT